MVSVAELTLVVSGKDNASKVLKDVGESAGGLGKALSGVAQIAGGFVLAQGILKAPGFLMDAASAAAEDEAATQRLQQAIHNLGGDYAANLAAVNNAIAAGQKLAFTDDDVRDSYQKLAAATGDSDEALRRQKAAMDLARGANIPLAQASTLLGKVNKDNVEVFKRMGITIGENATEADALAAVQAKFGGQAATYAKSTAGQFEVTKIKMGEVKEQIGTALLPIMAKLGTVFAEDILPKIEQFANAVGPKLAQIGGFVSKNVLPKLAELGDWFQNNVQPKIEAFIAWVGPKLDEFGKAVQAEFKKVKQYYESDLKPALDNIQVGIEAVIAFVREHWPEIETIVRPVLDAVLILINTAKEVILDVLNIVIKLIQGDWSGAWRGVQELISDVWNGIVGTITNSKDLILGILGVLKDLALVTLGALWDLAKQGFSALKDSAVELVTELKDSAITKFGELLNFMQGLPAQLLTIAGEMGNAIRDGLIGGIKGTIGVIGDLGEALLSALKALINTAVDAVNNAIPNSLNLEVLGKSIGIDLPDNPIPHLASGGIVRARPGGTLALLAEGGHDEAVIPLDGRHEGTGGGVTNHFYRPVQLVLPNARSADDFMRGVSWGAI